MAENAMEDLASAWDKVESESSEDTSQEASTEATLEESGNGDFGESPVEDATIPADGGEETEGEEDDLPEAAEAAEAAESTEADETAEGEESESYGEPPASWNAEARELWKDLPKKARDYIQLREQQVAQGLEKHRQNAERAKSMDRSLAPYQQLFAMNGGAKPVIEGLLQTGASLQMGSPMQQAQTVANIIKRFGVDVQTLDSLLVGEEAPEQVRNQDQIQQAVQQALTPYQQQMQQFQMAQQQAAQQTEHQAQTELQQFANDPNNKFFPQVRNRMADLFDLAEQNGERLTLQEAYDRACYMDPTLRQQLIQQQSSSNLGRKRKAAASVAGSPRGTSAPAQPEDIRGTIEQAWEQAGRM